ncbi:MAG: hypothetical protein WA803_08750 [Steroidobacteraceae bacterium]
MISTTRIRHGLWLAAVWALAACGGSGGGMSSMNSSSPAQSTAQACSNCGMAVVSMTDAPGDFISYMVNVVSLQLKRADGTVVETVPVTTQVDFAQLVNLSEIISAEQIPPGNYVSAAITLDFSSATIVVDNGTTGVTIAAGSVINGATSLPLAAPNPTQMTLNLDLSHNQFIVTEHAIANLALDFNLAASNTIAPSDTNPMTVTVNPVLTASLVPDATKQIRVRGPLVSVDASTSSYIISVRPFFNSSGTAGQFTVNTTATTTFSINNVSSTGSAGLMQLAAVAAGTDVVAYGSWDKSTQTFTASNVLAGSSVPGMTHDSVEGTVLSRTLNTLTVANGVIFPIETDDDADDMRFARQVTVTVGTGTMVTEDGQMGAFTIQDISVGQHLQLSGKLGQDSSGNPTLDATAGSARLMVTSLSGTVTSLATNLVTVNLQSLDGQMPLRFNFAGTGSGTGTTNDATAAAYAVGVPSALALSTLSVGAPVRFAGFVAPFGQAPPDFNASTLLSFAQTRALLDLKWPTSGSTAPFATLTATELLIDQAVLQTTVEHYIRVGFEAFDPTTLATGLELIPDPAASTLWLSIVHTKSESSENFSAFADFTAALKTDLNGTNAVVHIAADGPYDSSSGTLSVDQMIVVIDD